LLAASLTAFLGGEIQNLEVLSEVVCPAGTTASPAIAAINRYKGTLSLHNSLSVAKACIAVHRLRCLNFAIPDLTSATLEFNANASTCGFTGLLAGIQRGHSDNIEVRVAVVILRCATAYPVRAAIYSRKKP